MAEIFDMTDEEKTGAKKLTIAVLAIIGLLVVLAGLLVTLTVLF